MNQHTLDVLEYDKVKELLVSYATSGLGKNLAREIHPLTDLRRIQQLIAETTELKSLLSPDDWLPLGGLHDLFPIMDKLDEGNDVLLTEEIILIKETLRACRIVKGYFEDTAENYPNLQRFADSISTYPEIEEKIKKTFGEGQTMQSNASPELKSIRKQVEILKGRVRRKLQSVIRSRNVNPYLQDTVVRERKRRPVIAVKARYASRIPGQVRDRSDSGNSLFIEPQSILGMGDELQEFIDAEKAEMARILREITAMIADKTKALRKTLKMLAHIDLTYAKVRFSRDYEMNPPLLNIDGVIELNGAKHPLLLALQREAIRPDISEKATEVVPINFRLGDDFNTLIITGPNTGGKTVTLKTVGLLTLMAQSGMHVPAEKSSKLAVFRQVFADIGDEQSLEQSLSTFSSHLTNISKILKISDENSLVLLDELGGGTDPAEGAALGRSIIKYLHERNVRTTVTTHISPLKNLGYTVPGIENASVEFDVVTLQPTYRLLVGTPGSSNALLIAKRLGLPSEVIEHAEEKASQGDENVSELINQLQSAKATAERNKRATEQAKTEAVQLKQEHQIKLQELTEKQERLQEELRQDAFASLREIKVKVDRMRSSVLSSQSASNLIDEIYEELAKQLEESPQAEQRKEFIQQLEVGDEVRVRSLDQLGKTIKIDSDAKQIVVQLGMMQMTTQLEDIERV